MPRGYPVLFLKPLKLDEMMRTITALPFPGRDLNASGRPIPEAGRGATLDELLKSWIRTYLCHAPAYTRCPLEDDGATDCLDEVAFARAWRAEEEGVLVLGDEVAGGEASGRPEGPGHRAHHGNTLNGTRPMTDSPPVATAERASPSLPIGPNSPIRTAQRSLRMSPAQDAVRPFPDPEGTSWTPAGSSLSLSPATPRSVERLRAPELLALSSRIRRRRP